MKDDLQVRRGTESDVEAALALITELAVYEKAPDQVVVTAEEMHNWGFGPDKIFDFFVLEKNGKVIGMALYYFKYSTWKGKCMFLEDLIITESERHKGYGHMLFRVIADEARKLKVRRLEWQVLEWNKPAIKFYEKWRAEFDGEWINCQIRHDGLQSLG